ncbi:MAG: hypothetical protein GQ574_25875 [Crocinitomix sp.]|nr:hypothetical protein [Crocinitomix sp.]
MSKIQKITVLFSILLLVACKSGNDFDYAQPLNVCMSEQDMALLNEACEVFELQLLTKYKMDNLSRTYRDYLQDVINVDRDSAFYTSPEIRDVLSKFRTTGLFEKIWQPASVVTERKYGQTFSPKNDSLKEEREFFLHAPEAFILDPDAPFSECMRSVIEVRAVQSYFGLIQASPNMSHNHVAFELAIKLTDEDADNGLTRIVIAMGFFYPIAMMFE